MSKRKRESEETPQEDKNRKTEKKTKRGQRACAEDDCLQPAQNGEKCIAHGGGYRCTAPDCEKIAKKKGRCTAHMTGTYYEYERVYYNRNIAQRRRHRCFCGRFAQKGDKCKAHSHTNDLKILDHKAPAPMELLVNITVKQEPIDADVEMSQATEPTPMDVLAAIAKMKEEAD